jgi:hypothetical protein
MVILFGKKTILDINKELDLFEEDTMENLSNYKQENHRCFSIVDELLKKVKCK